MRIENHSRIIHVKRKGPASYLTLTAFQTSSFHSFYVKVTKDGTKKIYTRILHLMLITLAPFCSACDINCRYTRLES